MKTAFSANLILEKGLIDFIHGVESFRFEKNAPLSCRRRCTRDLNHQWCCVFILDFILLIILAILIIILSGHFVISEFFISHHFKCGKNTLSFIFPL